MSTFQKTSLQLGREAVEKVRMGQEKKEKRKSVRKKREQVAQRHQEVGGTLALPLAVVPWAKLEEPRNFVA